MANPWERSWNVQSTEDDKKKAPWEMDWQVSEPAKPTSFLSEVGSALTEGAEKTYRSARAALSTYLNLGDDVVAQSARSGEVERNSGATSLSALKQDIAARKKADDDSLWSGIRNVVGAIVSNPKGGAELVVEQAPNSAVALGTGVAGAKAGALLGTAVMPGVGTAVGGTVGFIAGLFGANTLLETGGKAIEAAQDGKFSPEDRDRVIREGTTKGAVITAVDTATLGASKYVLGAASRAVEQATARTLADAGIDAAKAARSIQEAQREALKASQGAGREAAREAVEKATVEAMAGQGLLTRDLVSKVQAAQKAAFDTALTTPKRLGRGGTAVGLESGGEALGEGLGEYAATGTFSPTEAILEGVAGLSQSLPELYVAKSLDQPGTLTQAYSPQRAPIEAPVTPPAPPAATGLNSPEFEANAAVTGLKMAVDPYVGIANAGSVSEAIANATAAVDVDLSGPVSLAENLQRAQASGLLQRQLDVQAQLDAASGLSAPATAGREAVTAPAPLPVSAQAQRLDRESELLAQRDGVTPVRQAAELRRMADQIEAAGQLLVADGNAAPANVSRADNMRQRAAAMRSRAEQIEATAVAPSAGPTQFDRDNATAQLETVRGQPRQGAAAGFVDLTPMTARQAQQRLAVLREETGQPLSLAVVPHPQQANRFAVARQELPLQAADLELPNLTPAPSPAAAQNRLESAALAGKEKQRRAEDAPRQDMISRTMANIEARGGVASPYEAELLRAANMGQPYNRIDPSLGRPASTDEKLTVATGIAVGQEAGLGFGARESTPQSRLSQPSEGRIITSGAKFSTQRVQPGQTVEVNDGGTAHQVRVADPGKLGVQGRLLQQIARIFGKRLVVFESDTLQADGFVQDNDNQSIYINAKSQISPLAVFGHELTHLLKRDNPKAYAALQAVVERNLDAEGKQRFDEYYGEGANLEELTSDLVGNRFREPAFWTEVFQEIAAQNGEAAGGIISRLAAALNKAVAAVLRVAREGGFASDAMVKDLDQIKAAVKTALAEYAKDQRMTAVQMEGGVLAEQSKVDLTAGSRAEPVAAETAPQDQAAQARGRGRDAARSALVQAEDGQERRQQTAKTQAAQLEAKAELLESSPESTAQVLAEAARLRERAQALLTRAAAPSGEGTRMSRERARPSTPAERSKARAYEEATGQLPYTSEGQIEVPLERDGAKFSVKRAYGDKEFAKGRANDPLTGLPLNKNGTVTLYMPTTNAVARELARTKKLTGARPDANRIYLTNESSGPKVMNEPGNIDAEMDGANVLLQVDPRLLHLDKEHADGRKDFFIPIAEGQAYKAKMTKLFTLDAPRTRALSKDTKLTDLQNRVGDAIGQYLAADSATQKAWLETAKEILKQQHNVGTLLGVNGKLEKTNTGGYGLNNYNGKDVMSMGLGLASAQKINEKNLSTCPNSAICEGLCLGETSGQNLLYGGEGQFKSGPRLAQYLKTEALVQNPEAFAIVLHSEIAKFQKAAVKEDYQPTVRLNVTSDFRPQTFEAVINAFPGVMFYDYTKLPSDSIAPNHHLTYSSTGASQVVNGKVVVNKESNWDKMVESRLMKGMNVAMAFTSRTAMPKYILDERTGERFQVWDGDNYDARFLDPKPGQPGNEFSRGMIIGLTNKDKTTKPEDAAVKHKGFFLNYDPAVDGDTLVIKDQKSLAGRGVIPIARMSRQRSADDSPEIAASRRRTFLLIHGGSDFDKIDSRFFGSGEPGNLRPLGKGFYGYLVRGRGDLATAVRMARAYTKYAPTEGRAIQAFKLTLEPGEIYFKGRVWDEDLLSDTDRAIRDGYRAANELSAPERLAAYEELEKKYPDTGERANKNSRALTTEVLFDGELIEAATGQPSRLKKLGRWPAGMTDDEIVGRLNEAFPAEMEPDAQLSRQRGINVRNDGDNRYADLIVDGEKTMESRDSDSLRPYVGQTVGIIRTGEGPAKLIGSVKIGEPIEVGEQQFRGLESEHLVPAGSTFDIKPGRTKFLYPLSEAERFEDERDVDTRGIVARDVQFSRQRTPLGFYSALAEGVGNIKTNAAPAAGWKDAIKGMVNKGQVKADEVEWSGVNDWLDLQKGRVTKEQVAEYLQQGGVKVEEVVLGRDALSREEQIELTKLRRQWDASVDMPDAKFERMQELARRMADAQERPAKYGEYVLPGGENYREVLLTLPTKAAPVEGRVVKDDKDSKYPWAIIVNGEEVNRVSAEAVANDVLEEELTRARKQAGKKDASVYRSRHWDQANVLAHIRVNDRTDVDGKRVLFVEEIQSDWGQEGKKKGFDNQRSAIDEELRRAGWALEQIGPEDWVITDRDGDVVAEGETANAALARAGATARNVPSVPTAPFVTKTEGWLNLALKRIMVMAAEGGYDKVAFATGQQNADRPGYDLSKQVDLISYTPTEKGYRIAVMIGGQNVKDGDFTRDELGDLVGKEIVQKMDAREGVQPFDPAVEPDLADVRELSGLDLKVGGEGMKAFYDQIVPLAVKKLLPKVGGGQMGVVNLTYDPNPQLDTWEPEDGEGDGSVAPIERYTQPGFDVTPAMREKVAEGLPQFSRRRDIAAAEEALDLVRKARAYEPMEGEERIAFPILYHSGTGDPDALAKGVEPQFGSWVAEVLDGAYDGETEIDPDESFVPLSYYASAPEWIRIQTARNLGKQYNEVTLDDIRNRGQLAIVYNVDEDFGEAKNKVFQIGPDGYNGGYTQVIDVYGKKRKLYETGLEEEGDFRSGPKQLFGVEPGDIVTNESIEPDVVLTGDALVEFMRRYQAEVDPSIKFSRQRQTDTPEFKRRFGDSVVRDEDGEPLVVYRGEHGKTKDGRLQSKLGSITFVEDPAVASTYAEEPNDRRDTPAAPRVVPAYLRLENPLFYTPDDPFAEFGDLEQSLGRDVAERFARKHREMVEYTNNWEENFAGKYGDVDELLDANPAALSELYVDAYVLLDDPEFVKAARAAGYDGAIHGGNGESMDTTEYRVFDRDQVISAIGGTDLKMSRQRQTGTPQFKRPVKYDKNTGQLDVGPGQAVRLSGLGRFGDGDDVLAAYVPQRSTHTFALHPDKWVPTFYSLTNKDAEKITRYKPAAVDIVPGTLVADMALANRFYRSKDEADARAYADSVKPLEDVDLATYRMPELLIPKQDEGIAASRRRNIFNQPAPLATWTAPDSTKMDDFLYTMQDKQVDMKRVVEAVKAQVGRIDDQWNPYLQEELFHGRTAKATKDFLSDEVKPLLLALQANKVEMAEFEEYLHNRHAEERNRQIAKVNPNMPDGGSGIDTADARAYLAALDPAKRAVYEQIARRVDAISKGTRELLVASGLETRETINKWEAAYQSYVPLMREDVDFASGGGMGTGQGYNVRGPSSKRATGSSRDVIDILANLMMQRERAVVRAEKTRVATAVYGMAIKNPNTDFWLAVDPAGQKDPAKAIATLVQMGMTQQDAESIIQEPTQNVIDPRTGLVVNRVNPLLRTSDNVLAARINGEEKYVFFNANDERALRMVRSLKSLDADQLGKAMGLVANVTRYFASINTQYNPIFGAVNFLRDVQGAIVNLSTTALADRKAEVLAGTMPALRGIYADLRARRAGKGPATGTWATLWEEYQNEGGQTGFRDMFSRSEQRAEALQAELNKISEGKAKQFGRAMFDWLSDYNETMENAVRLSAYKAAIDKGMSKQQAASIAKNLTVNFNRKGQVALQAGAAYAFFNASVQGSARLAETLTGPAGKKILAGGLLLGTAQAMLLAAAGFDEDEPPEFARERNLILPIGDGKYFQAPLPLGLHVIPNTSRILTEWAMSGFREPGKRVAQITGAFLDAFNPIGNAGWSLQTIAPTVVDPIAALAENKDWTGKPIYREDRSGTNPTPGYSRAKDTATWFSKQLAYYLNLASGGTAYKQGAVSPTPDQIDYLIGVATGGVGREVQKIEQSISSSITGEELPPYKVPGLGRFYGDTTAGASESAKFYANITRLNEHEAEIKGRRKNREPMGDYFQEYPEARLVDLADRIEREVQELRRKRKTLIEQEAPAERVKLLEERIKMKMKQLNDRVKQVRESADVQ